MAQKRLSQWARCVLSALFVATLLPTPTCSAPSDTMELDIITPVAGGLYRVNPGRLLAIVVAVQNKAIGDSHGWRFDWTVSSVSAVGKAIYADSGKISTPQGGLYTAVTIQDGDPFIGISNALRSDNGTTPVSKPMPPGDYHFEWVFSVGPWCEFVPDQSMTWALSWPVKNGSFRITVADDAPWPELDSTSCPSVAGQVSFLATTEYPATNQATPTTLACVQTAVVTEKPEPCRATVGKKQAASISSFMMWSGDVRSTTSLTTSSSVLKSTGTVGSGGKPTSTTRPNSGGRLTLNFYYLEFLLVLFWIA